MRRLLFILILFCLAAAPAWADFKGELYHTTFPTTAPAAIPDGWDPAMWTTGALNASFTADDIRALAHLCRYGGDCKKYMPQRMYNYLKYYDRLEIFPNERVPAGTLLICDFEGQNATDYPVLLCGNTLAVTHKFAQYPGIPGDGSVNFTWTSQMREVDFYCLMRGWATSKTPGTDAKKIRDVMGDYMLMELYLYDPKLPNHATQDEQFRAWSILLNSMRAEFPKKKILALVQGGYANPGTGTMSDAERQRIARSTLMYDGVWCFGFRDSAAPVMRDISMLADDPLHLFAGEERWAK